MSMKTTRQRANERSTCFDPYDLWASPIGIKIREKFYQGAILGKISAAFLSLLDWFFPHLIRKIFKVKPISYPIVVAHQILQQNSENKITPSSVDGSLFFLKSCASPTAPYAAWGLRFSWMSKNGLYGPEIPFVTHTPYVMEALLALANHRKKALDLFYNTWGFLEDLRVMYQGADGLALSYAPINEPRIVINANAYAAFAYGLHACYGRKSIRSQAREKANRIAKWVTRQQNKDGSWFYYADTAPGNFIDCFHSCFILKNLLKVKKLLPEINDDIFFSIESGWNFIRKNLYDSKHGLCRRFAIRDIRDPYRWDLYDQAEYLGLLVDFGLLDDAVKLAKNVNRRFQKKGNWYCRIDLLGRRWGKNFLRWGIVPFWYQNSRLTKALKEKEEKA